MPDDKPPRRTSWDVILSAKSATWADVARMCVMAACISLSATAPVIVVTRLAEVLIVGSI